MAVLRVSRRRVLQTAGAVGALGMALGPQSLFAAGDEDETRFRWDIIRIDFAAHTINAGGIASAIASDGSTITLTGDGTFVPGEGFGNGDVTGGGTWQTFDPSGNSAGSGTYQVTGFVSFTEFLGVPPPLTDLIGAPSTGRSGLAFLAIGYSDGSRGVLAISCAQPGPPAIVPHTVFEGIRVSKDLADYWNGEEPPAPPGNGNRTLFHILGED